jgi:hypothetical protein
VNMWKLFEIISQAKNIKRDPIGQTTILLQFNKSNLKCKNKTSKRSEKIWARPFGQ